MSIGLTVTFRAFRAHFLPIFQFQVQMIF